MSLPKLAARFWITLDFRRGRGEADLSLGGFNLSAELDGEYLLTKSAIFLEADRSLSFGGFFEIKVWSWKKLKRNVRFAGLT